MKQIVLTNPDTNYKKAFKVSKATLNDVKLSASTIRACKIAFAINQTNKKWLEEGKLYYSKSKGAIFLYDGYEPEYEYRQMNNYINYLKENAICEIVDENVKIVNAKKEFKPDDSYYINKASLTNILERKDIKYSQLSEQLYPKSNNTYLRNMINRDKPLDFATIARIAKALDVPFQSIVIKK